jgi:hypothetical protein
MFSAHSVLLLPSLFLTSIPYPMTDKQILAEEILGEVIESHILGPKSVCSSYSRNAGEFVHVLISISLIILLSKVP